MAMIGEYEKQYAATVGEMTTHIGKLKFAETEQRRELIKSIENNHNEATELLDLISVEIHEAEPAQRRLWKTKLNCLQVELQRLQKEYEAAKQDSKERHRRLNNHGNTINMSYGTATDADDEYSLSLDQRESLLKNSDLIEHTGHRLNDAYRVTLETEEIGAQVLNDLHHQRETLHNARNRLNETNAELGFASRTLSAMMSRALREKLILYAVGFFFVVAVVLSLYYSFKGHSKT